MCCVEKVSERPRINLSIVLHVCQAHMVNTRIKLHNGPRSEGFNNGRQILLSDDYGTDELGGHELLPSK
jgi:hypothetical protein